MLRLNMMPCFAWFQMGRINIEHNNGDDYGDDGHAYDRD